MRKRMLASGICLLLFLALILLLKTVDVADVFPAGTSIGLSHMNVAVHEFFGYNPLWYRVTEYLGYASFLVVAFFALMGLWQLIRRRSLRRVDSAILALGVLFVVVLAIYFLFGHVVVNWRPMLLEDGLEPEPSFPSSHTMMACTVYGAAFILLNKYLRGRPLRLPLQLLCAVLIDVMVVGRLASGVHWLTDILGSVLLCGFLLTLFSAVLMALEHTESAQHGKQ